MIRVTTSSVVNAPAPTVWEAIRDFNAMPAWHPAIASSEVEEGGASDRIGCVRRMERASGGTIRERLLALSDAEHAVTYSILSSPMPVSKYVATLRVIPVTDADRSFVTWTAEFEVPAEQEAEMRHTIGVGVFQTGFDGLKRRFGG